MWALLPIKKTAQTKSRLSCVLNQTQRIHLSQAIYLDVLDAIQNCQLIKHLIIIGTDIGVESSGTRNFEFIEDPKQGLNYAITYGVDYAYRQGATQLLVLHADLPFVKSSHLEYVIQAYPASGISLVPDHKQDGTNCLITELPRRIEFQYGSGSFNKHQNAAADVNIPCQILAHEAIGLDIDYPEDLRWLLRGDLNFHTRKYVAQLKEEGILTPW